jgi:hypothetical protein
MSPGLLIGWIVTGFGVFAGGAILAAYFIDNLMPKVLALWVVFPVCIGIGLFIAMMFAARSGASPLMRLTGHFLAVLGVTAGAMGLAAIVDLWSTPHPTGPLWILLALAMPIGLVLHNAGRIVDEAGQKE